MKNYLQPKKNLYGLELPNSDPLIIGQVARVLQASGSHIYNLVRAEELQGTNISVSSRNASWRISRNSLVNFIERRTTGPISEVDFHITAAPHGLKLPEGHLLRTGKVAVFLSCSNSHISELIVDRELTATNIGLMESGQKNYRIARSSLIHFINLRTEGAY